jgi:response regulator NasT
VGSGLSMSAKVMLVCQSRQKQKELEQAVAKSGYQTIASVMLEADLQQTLEAAQADVIVFDIDRPDQKLLARTHTLNQQHAVPIVMFAEQGDKATIIEAVNAGVTSYVVDGFSVKRLLPIVEAALARFKAIQSLHQELQETKSKLEDRKHIDKAKGILMLQKEISEEQAYQALRKLAMDRNIKIGEAARNIIAMAELFG